MELTALEKEKDEILKKIRELGDLRSGSLSVRYQKCGKMPCACHEPGHPGHGPIYSFSELIQGKTKIRNFKVGPELDKLSREVETYQTFKKLSQELITISNRICDLRPTPVVEDANEMEDLKKNLRKLFMRKYKRRLTG